MQLLKVDTMVFCFQVGAGGPMGVSPQQAMFMQQQNSRGAFSQGPGNVLQGPLAYLEKTTSNIGKQV